MKKTCFTLALLVFSTIVFGAKTAKSTYVYEIKGNDTLRLDKYEVQNGDINKPCMIFVFGGGFTHGQRDSKTYLNYFNKLAEAGFVVASIDYRLGLRNASKEPTEAMQLVFQLKNAIDMAVEDLYSATNFVIKHSEEWHLDKNNILVSGSSAGAITALQAEYYLHSTASNLVQKLPEKFKYAGVISFAGAIFSTSGDLKWTSNPAPIQFFHGDADKNVPYDEVKFLPVCFLGSKYLTGQLEKTKSPYQFLDFHNMNHAIAETPMNDYLPEILNFISKWVLKKKNISEHIRINDFSLPDVRKDFGIEEYIQSNFPN